MSDASPLAPLPPPPPEPAPLAGGPPPAPEPDAPPEFIPGDWSPIAAAKKVGWAMVQWKVAVAAGAASSAVISPAMSAAVDKISDFIEPYGFTLSMDPVVFDKFIPVIIFASMIVAHDFAKFKTKKKWL